MNSIISNAIATKKLLRFDYEGGERIVEPHCYGITTAGNEGLRAYQIDGYSSSGAMGWKMFDLSKADYLEVLDDTFASARPGYKRGDRGMKKIFREL